MAYDNINELAPEIREGLPQHAQQIFVAAFNAAQSNGMNDSDASEVAWSSVRNQFYQGQDGKWHIKTDDGFQKGKKAVVSGGN